MQKFSFPRQERLKSSKIIASLFENGKSFSAFPLRVVYIENEYSTSKLQVAFTVPKRAFKRAVDRNLLKRRMREAYRLNKNIILHDYPDDNSKFAVMFIYTTKEIMDSDKIHQSMVKVLKQLKSKLFT